MSGNDLGELSIQSDGSASPTYEHLDMSVSAEKYQGNYALLTEGESPATTPTEIRGAVVSAPNQTYDGAAHTPAPTVKLADVELKEGTDYEVVGSTDLSQRYSNDIPQQIPIRMKNETAAVRECIHLRTSRSGKGSG